MLSLLSLMVTMGAFAAEDLPWKLVKGGMFIVPPYGTVTTDSPQTAATVKNVDPVQKTITLQVNERMLQNLQAGDSAQVTIRKHLAAR